MLVAVKTVQLKNVNGGNVASLAKVNCINEGGLSMLWSILNSIDRSCTVKSSIEE